ncbi:uncharacterized protein LOC106641938 [Copidosoma floridanum]|uniref:uncharacterized protein LOC106641938 n=1 Tax=Copidosoma floridanum TaxID=29053 RepID=UPI000C6F6FCC|nr:uncharacterized protein LOC106641938 [Copidosoma floridanum]
MMPPPLAAGAILPPPPPPAMLPRAPPASFATPYPPIFYWPYPSPPVSPTNYYNPATVPGIAPMPQQAALLTPAECLQLAPPEPRLDALIPRLDIDKRLHPSLQAHCNQCVDLFMIETKNQRVDAVVVCSPTYTHEGIVTRALEAKKAVFCEKPIAENPEDTAKCYEAADKFGKPLFCAFNRRFDPSYSNVRQRLRSGEIGHVHTIKLVARDSPLPSIDYLKISGGIFHDCMVHDIDLMTYTIGEYPTKVAVYATAHIPEIRSIKDWDTVVAIFKFPSGTVGTVDLSRNSCYGYDQRLEVFGPRGMIDATNEQPLHCVTTQIGLAGQRRPPIYYSFASRFKLAYHYEMEAFIDVVLGKAKPLVHPKEILAVSKIASACEESAKTGKSVDISWTPSELPPPTN